MSRLYEALTKAENGRSAETSIEVVGSSASNTFPRDLHNGAEHPSTIQRYVEPLRLEAAATPGYDKLRDYWDL